jgi:hypothetical protein
MANPYLLLSPDAQLALTEFSDALQMALTIAAPNTWAKDFALLDSSGSPRTVYPLPVSAAKYVLRDGDDKMRKLLEKSVSVQMYEYQDGVQERATMIEAPDFFGWPNEPARIANETQRHPNILIAALLKANPTLEFDGKAMFASDHPINVLDDSVTDVSGNTTFDNDFSSAAATSGTDLIKTAAKYFRTLPGANGRVMGLQLSDVIVPAALEETFKVILNSDLMYNAYLAGASNTNIVSSNLYKGAVNLVVAPELEDDNVVYWVAKNGPAPWILKDGGSPEEIVYDKSSDHYKNTGYIGLKYVLKMGTAAALPHAIARQTIT